ncbi:MAG: UbiA family prenyltransferase [Gemmatimonadaceae bacterium]|nr:UbiA family prenyltransferase [Gemmatimonadaceae bacterium]
MTVTEGRVPVREGQTFGGTTRFVKYANFVKLPHTVFALPFALVGVTLASYRAPVTIVMLGWVVVAFTSARFTGMGFNRIVDREIDGRNPRTSMREIPSGAMTVREASVAVAVSSALFIYSAWSLNALCAVLSPLALVWVCFYSYTKRFTRWSHLVLGVGMSIAPVGGYLAVTGQWPSPWWMPLVLSLAVTTWGAGFDILYALQDEAFDTANGLFSIPVAVGQARAIRLSRALHLATVVSLAVVGLATDGALLFGVGVLVVAALLLYEHSLVRAGDLSRLDAAFFLLNGMISIVFFLIVLAERLLRGAGWGAAVGVAT